MRPTRNNSVLLAAATIAVLLLVAIVWARFSRTDFVRIIGAAQPYSEHYELPDLALDLVFDELGESIISRQEDGQILAWKIDGSRQVKIGETDAAFDFCASQRLLLTSNAGKILVNSLKDGSNAQIADGKFDHIAVSADCATVALSKMDEPRVEIWSLPGTKIERTVELAEPARNGLAISDDGRILAAAEGTYNDLSGHKTRLAIAFLDKPASRGGLVSYEEPGVIVGMWSMVFSPDSEALFVGSQVNARSGLRRFSTNDASVEWKYDGFKSYWVRAFAISPSGRVLATGDEKGNLRLWDSNSGELISESNAGMVIQSLSFSGDGTTLAVGLKDSTIGLVAVAQ